MASPSRSCRLGGARVLQESCELALVPDGMRKLGTPQFLRAGMVPDQRNVSAGSRPKKAVAKAVRPRVAAVFPAEA